MTRESAFDFSTSQLGVVYQNKPLLYLSSWLTRSYRAALETGQSFVVVSPPVSAVTLPLEELLSRPGCRWVATTSDGRFFDAATGQILQWQEQEFISTHEPVEEFLQAAAGTQGAVRIQADVVHPASASTRIGRFCERIFEELTGSAPTGWGLLEPVSEAWDVARVSDYFRVRAPMPTTAVVLGKPRPGTIAPSIATLSLERSSRGVHEIVTFLAETAEPLDDVAQAVFAATMHEARARHAVLGHGLGYTSLARPARYTGPTVPACAVFGPEALEKVGAQRALELANGAGRLLGPSPVQSMAVFYPTERRDDQHHPLLAYDQLVSALTDGTWAASGRNGTAGAAPGSNGTDNR